jgi:Family of unknown function (DUF5941)
MSATPAQAAPVTPRTDAPLNAVVYRDDGPLSRAIGRLAGRRVPSVLALLVAIAPLVAAVAVKGADASDALVGGVIAWLILLGGISSASLPLEHRRWTLPVLVRLGEYMTLVWIAAIAGPGTYPAAYALLAALAFRHYDLVYRLRHRAEVPPRWLDLLAGGWEGRLVLAYVLLVVGGLPAGFFIWAGILGVIEVGETVASWRAFERSRRPALYDEDEDEDVID